MVVATDVHHGLHDPAIINIGLIKLMGTVQAGNQLSNTCTKRPRGSTNGTGTPETETPMTRSHHSLPRASKSHQLLKSPEIR